MKAILKVSIAIIRFAYQQWILEECYSHTNRLHEQIGWRRVSRIARMRARTRSKYILRDFEMKWTGECEF